jgi:hypothetical protein
MSDDWATKRLIKKNIFLKFTCITLNCPIVISLSNVNLTAGVSPIDKHRFGIYWFIFALSLDFVLSDISVNSPEYSSSFSKSSFSSPRKNI